MISTISIASIDTADRLRTLDPAWVALLAEEIAADGLVEPISVTPLGEGYKLIAGARRVAAHLELGWSEIEAIVNPALAAMTETEIRLAEIKSHMLRSELTALDRAVTVAAWCDIYKAANGQSKPGRKPKFAVVDGGYDEALEELSNTMLLNWSEAAQKALGIVKMTLFRHLKVARIDGSLRERISLHPIANVQKELLLLASQTPARQKALVDLVTTEGSDLDTISAAIAQFDATAQAVKPVAPYERMSERFAKLDRKDQERFFALHADQIQAWLAKSAASRKAA